MKAVMFGMALVVAMGCGKKEEPEPKDQAKAPEKPADQDSEKGQPKLEPKVDQKKPGDAIWEFQIKLRGQISSPAIGLDGTVFVGSDSRLLAIDGKNRTKKWSTPAWGNIGMGASPSIADDGAVYAGGAGGQAELMGYNGVTGEIITIAAPITAKVHSFPAIGADGTIYAQSANTILAIDRKKGDVIWKLEGQFYGRDSRYRCSPAIGADGTIYAGSGHNKFYALDGKSGAKKWEFHVGSERHSSPAIGSDGTVYFGSSTNIYSLVGMNGAKKWVFNTGSKVSSPAIGNDGTIYFGSMDKKVYALKPDGSKKWEFVTGEEVHSSPAIGSDETVYIGSNDKKIYALDGTTGAKKWEFETGDKVRSSPAIGSDGTLYIGSDDGKVYALKTASQGPAKSSWPMHGQNPRRTGRWPKDMVPTLLPPGKRAAWTFNVNSRSIDQYFRGKTQAIIEQTFGKPDKLQGQLQEYWGYTGVNVSVIFQRQPTPGLPRFAPEYRRCNTVWFVFEKGVVQQVRIDK